MGASETTIIAGIEIPSVSPVFLTLVGIHVLLGIACVITGLMAMLSEKRRGRHPQFGTIYYWCLAAVFATATFLSVMRWAEDYHLFILGALSFTAVFLGRTARRQGSIRLHILYRLECRAGGAMSYASTGAAAGRAFNSSSAKRALRLRPAEIASTPIPM